MSPIRVLVVDDSVVVRRLVTNVLDEDPDIEVIGSAASGRIALERIATLKPDAMTLDIEMPDMDGLETLKAVRPLHPHLPIIMFSTLTERAASATLEALTLGASDYVTKPSNVGSVAASMAAVREQLVPKLKALCPRSTRLSPVVRTASAPLPPVLPRQPARPIAVRPRSDGPQPPAQIVAIGASTGGPDALAKFFTALPADFRLPIVLVQHMPPIFTRLFAERLNKACAMQVVEAEAGMQVQPGVAYIAPGGFHLTIVRTRAGVETALDQNPPENSCRPAVDVLFRSVAAAYGATALGVIFTGMGSDGQRGSESLRAAGARIFAQNEATCVVYGMPRAVVTAGLADRVLPLHDMARAVADVRRGAKAPAATLKTGA